MLNKHICKNCNKEFYNYFKDGKFCSQDCMKEYRKNNSILSNRKCKLCGKIFNAHDNKVQFCSKKCSGIARRKRQLLICDCCGKQFERINSEIVKNKNHFCSFECKILYSAWTKNDLSLLINNYGKMKYEEIKKILYSNRSISEIKRKANELGITKNNYWSENEISILVNNYENKTLIEVKKMLPNRTISSILTKARDYNLYSLNTLVHRYTNDEDEYIKNNYNKMRTKEIADKLNRTKDAIIIRANKLGIYKDKTVDCYSSLYEYIRKRMQYLNRKMVKEFGNKCFITGQTENLVIHHITGFNLLLLDAIELYGFPLYDNLSDYKIEELESFLEMFINYHSLYAKCVCITQFIHKEFHKIYGYGNNTEEQWNDFINKNYNLIQ